MRRSICAPLVVAALLAAEAPAQDGEVPQIVDVRIGQHRAYDRVVLELERAARVSRRPVAPGEDLVLELGARPLLPRQEIATGSPRFEWLILEETLEGARVRLRAPQARVRVFWLGGPVRLVIDVAEAGEAPFEPPPGAAQVEASPPEPIEAVVPEPVLAEVTSQESISVSPREGEPGGPVEIAPEEPFSEPLEPEEIPLVLFPPQESAPGTEPHPEPSPQEVAPPVGLPPQPLPPESLPPEAAPLPMPPGTPDRPELPGPGEPGYERWLVLLIWVGGPLLILGVVFYLTRARRRMSAEPIEPRPPESITPGEVMSASDRLDLLEKRIDEELRARMQLEHRVVMVQEDLKVVRDRVIRLGRRSEGLS